MEKSVFTHEYSIFLATLRQARQTAGLTQAELGARIGDNQVFVSRYERGETRLDIVQIRTICHALGTTLAEFVGEYEKRLASRKRRPK